MKSPANAADHFLSPVIPILLYFIPSAYNRGQIGIFRMIAARWQHVLFVAVAGSSLP
jgi:hypothetical protein